MALPLLWSDPLVGSLSMPWYSQRSPKRGSAVNKDRQLSGWSQSQRPHPTTLLKTKHAFGNAVADCNVLAHSLIFIRHLRTRTRTWTWKMFLTSGTRPRLTQQLRCGLVVLRPSSCLEGRPRSWALNDSVWRSPRPVQHFGLVTLA